MFDTVNSFERAGVRLYNIAALAGPIGTVALRVGRQFQATRKLGRCHQYLQTFFKGDPRSIPESFGRVIPPPTEDALLESLGLHPA